MTKNEVLKSIDSYGLTYPSNEELEVALFGKPANDTQRKILFEIIRRNNYKGVTITTPEQIIPFVRGYSVYKEEHFLCVSLSGAREIISINEVAIGSSTRCFTSQRNIFEKAILDNASGIILVHNHPSGNCTPSEADKEMTERVVEAGKVLGIQVLDHIIVSQTSYFSFLEHDLGGL